LSHAVRALRERVADEGDMEARDWGAVVILLITIALWVGVSDRIGLGTAAMIGVSLYLISGIARWEDLSGNINWGVILIYASAISLGVTMKATGAADWLARELLLLLGAVGVHGGLLLFLSIAVITMAVAMVISSGATVGLIGPVALQMAHQSGTNVVAAGLVTAVASAATFTSTLGSPACRIVYSAGQLRRADFLRAGWKMNLAALGLVVLTAAMYWESAGSGP
jgi:sodium-dependent dicarboxylate transporter 2/3/5